MQRRLRLRTREATRKGYDITNIDRNLRTGYSEQYSLAAQRELPGGFLLEATDVGAQAHKLPYVVNSNQPRLGGVPKTLPDLGKATTGRNGASIRDHSGQFKLKG